MRVLAVLSSAWALAGCQVLSTIAPDGGGLGPAHTSALLAGEPFESRFDERGRGREDTLDVIEGTLFWERGEGSCRWYTEANIGYVYRDGGFYISPDRPPIVFTARTQIRFKFNKR